MNTKEELIKGTKRLIEIAFAPEQFATELDLNIHAGVGEAPTYQLRLDGRLMSMPEVDG